MTKISIIIPTYNSSDLVIRAIDSALNQTHDEIEVIVVDDASTDNTEQVIDSHRNKHNLTHVRHDENKGASAARNTGLAYATGDYIAYLDADDEWHPRKLEKQLTTLESKSDDWVAVHCGIDWQGPLRTKCLYFISSILTPNKKTSIKEGGEELIKDVLLMNLLTGSSTLLVRRETVEKIGGFDPNFPRHQDLEFLIRILEEGKLAYVGDLLVTKYHTGKPSIQDYATGKEMLLTKFSDRVTTLEDEGYPITKLHHLQMCKRYFANGQIIHGFQKLREYVL